jgi:hypothetical protein
MFKHFGRHFFILCLSLSHCPMFSQNRQTLSNYLSFFVWLSDYSFGLSALVTMFEHFGRHHISIKISFNIHLFLSALHFPGIGNHSLTISPSYRGTVTIVWIIFIGDNTCSCLKAFYLNTFFSFHVYLFLSIPCFPRIGNHSLTISLSYCGAVTIVWLICLVTMFGHFGRDFSSIQSSHFFINLFLCALHFPRIGNHSYYFFFFNMTAWL